MSTKQIVQVTVATDTVEQLKTATGIKTASGAFMSAATQYCSTRIQIEELTEERDALVRRVRELEGVITGHFSAPEAPANSGAAAVYRELAGHFKERGSVRHTGRQLSEWFRLSAHIIERESKS